MITNDAALTSLVETLQQHSVVAFDIESNGLHAYQEQVCLIQVSVAIEKGVVDYIIDPLTIEDMQPLGSIFADPAIAIVFHAAEYDIVSLKRDFAFEFAGLFDTYMAVRTLGWQKVGLQNVLQREFDVVLDKKYQQADWSKRPLTDEQLCYAQLDTHYLIELRARLYTQLEAQGLVAEANEYFEALCAAPPATPTFDPEGFWRMRDAYYLDDDQAAVLRELYLWRDTQAQQRDVPAFKVMGDKELLAIAKVKPRSMRALYKVRRVSKRHIERYGRHIIAAVKKGGNRRPPKRPPRSKRPDDKVLTRYDALRQWRKERAYARGVESDIIITKQALWDIATQGPTTPHELAEVASIWPYRREKYGAEILAVLADIEG